MSTPVSDVPALLGSRICHDLVSPLSAISNGFELLQMSGVAEGPEIALISESIEAANARIKFFRVAFGAASDEQKLSASDIAAILDAMASGMRFEIDWQVTGDLTRSEAKIAFLLLQCFEAALPWGGTVRVDKSHAGEWRFEGTSERLRVEETLWQSLRAPGSYGAQISAAQVQFLLLPPLLAETGRSARVDCAEARIVVRY